MSDYKYPSFNDREFDLLKKLTNNTAYIAEFGGGAGAVTSVNSMTGAVVLGYSDVGAPPSPAVKSADFTASANGYYVATATLTVIDPTPAEGMIFQVLIRAGTATIGGTAYSTPGSLIARVYHSGAWANYDLGGVAGVSSVFGRSGDVIANSADYSSYYGGLSSNNTWTGTNSWANADVGVYTAMPALDVDVTKWGNSYSATGNVTFTYSATPDAGTMTRLRITADGTARTITIPTTWSLARGGNITSLLVPANTVLQVLLQYNSARWEIIGDPPATTGTGSYVLANDAALGGVPTAPTAALDTNTTQIATTAFVLANDSSGWPTSNSLRAMGSSVKASNFPPFFITTTNNMGDGTVYFIAVYLPHAATITGAYAWMATQGSYNADNNNKVGLYSYSAGNLTLVASSADDGTLWKATSNSYIKKAFSTPYSAASGVYFVAFLWNTSDGAPAQVPVLGRAASVTSAAVNALDTTNSGKLYGTLASQTDLPAGPTAMSSLTASGTVFWGGIY